MSTCDSIFLTHLVSRPKVKGNTQFQISHIKPNVTSISISSYLEISITLND